MRIGWITDLAKNASSFFSIPTYSGEEPGQGSRNTTYMMKQSMFNSIASGCIYMISTSMSEAPLKVYRRAKSGDDEAEDHWMAELIRRPNPFLSPFEIWELTGIYMNTAGASYFELVRTQNNPTAPVLEMYPLRPDRIIPEMDSKRFITGYRYKPDNAGEVFYQPWQVLRIPFLDPFNLADEISPASRAAQEIDIDFRATGFTHRYLTNYGVPPGVLSTDQEITPDQANDIEERWWQKFNPFRGKIGRVPVLGKGSSFQAIGQNFRDMEFESIRNFVETRICGVFGVDPVLLPSWTGITHGGKYSNYAEARRHLWDETIIPLLRRIESKINSQVLSHEPNYYVKFDLSEVQALQENQTEKAQRMRILFDSEIAKLNEVREVVNLDSIGPEGDLFKSEIRAERIKKMREEMGGGEDEGDEEDEPSDKTDDEDKDVEQNSVKLEGLSSDEYIGKIQAAQRNLEKKFQTVMSGFFRDQKKAVVKEVNTNAIDDEQRRKIERQITKVITRSEGILLDLATEHLAEMILTGGEIGAEVIGPDFELDNADVIEFIEAYSLKFAQGVNDATDRQIRGILRRGFAEQWSVTKIRDKIREKFNDYSKERAQTIARTEVIRASSGGSKFAWKKAGVRELQWLAAEGDACPFCEELDGMIVGIDDSFVHEGEEIRAQDEDGNDIQMKVDYESVDHPPVHPNCRCAIIPVV